MVEDLKKYDDEKKTPEVGTRFEDIVDYATDELGVDSGKIDEMEGRYAHLPGRSRRCDVMSGPCACGAWH